jgi:hypothetical protein
MFCEPENKPFSKNLQTAASLNLNWTGEIKCQPRVIIFQGITVLWSICFSRTQENKTNAITAYSMEDNGL